MFIYYNIIADITLKVNSFIYYNRAINHTEGGVSMAMVGSINRRGASSTLNSLYLGVRADSHRNSIYFSRCSDAFTIQPDISVLQRLYGLLLLPNPSPNKRLLGSSTYRELRYIMRSVSISPQKPESDFNLKRAHTLSGIGGVLQ